MNTQANSWTGMKKKIRVVWMMVIFLSLVPGLVSALPAFLDRRPDSEQRQTILENSEKVLAKLYAEEPDARKRVTEAYGYATFSNFGVKIFLAGSGSGRGVAVNNQTQAKIFMNMAEIQAGLGLGVKKFMLVWVFENEKAFNTFINSGWELGGQASAAAKAGGKGGAYQGAIQVANGIWIYQMTEAGLAVELTAKGTKYYRDNDLNTAK